LGVTLATVGDCDGDGHADIGFGAGGAIARVHSGFDGSLLFEWREPKWPGIPTRACVAGLGDIDGDGRADVATGYPSSPLVAPAAGRVRAWKVGLPAQVGAPFGFGDGSGAACPCGNTNSGQTQAGCRNSTGAGAELRALGSTSLAVDDLKFQLTGTKPDVLSILLDGTQSGGVGVAFADGLLVVGGTIKRRQALSNCTPLTTFGPGLQASAHWAPGNARYFQAWFRDAGGPCGSGANTSNGIAVTFTP
jgi:hypothetical protein